MTSLNTFLRLTRALAGVAILTAIIPGLRAAAATATTAATAPLQELDYSGSQQSLEALDRDLASAGNDRSKLAPIETRLLQVLRRAGATFAARQAACQRLAMILAFGPPPSSGDAYKPLGTMLADERDSDLARLALEPAPGKAIDALFVTALTKTTGRTRLGLIDSLGRRRAATAVPALALLLKNADKPTASAAAHALGQIGDSAALAAVRAAPDPIAPAIAAAKLVMATRLPAAEAAGLLQELQDNVRLPGHVRAAALRAALEREPDSAATRIVEVLGGEDWTPKQAALGVIATLPTANIVPALTAPLDGWDVATQTAVIAALARRGDAAAVPALVAAIRSQNAEVRAAAISGLGFLPGNRDTAGVLARLTAGQDADDAKLARQSLAQLNGPDVIAAILAGAERGEPALRSVYIEQLALRNLTEGLPLLLKCRGEADASIRAAALGALGDLAPATELRALLEWAMAATDSTEQSRALRSLVNVTLRDPNVEERGRPVFEALDRATAEVCLRLLPALPRLGGTASAECAARMAVRSDAKVADAATAALTRWTDSTALPSLATVAEKATVASARTAALQGALRYLERNREEWTAGSTDLVARLLATPDGATERKRLVAFLNRANDERAIALAESLQSDPAVGDSARDAAAVIRANLAGPPTLRGSGATSQLKNVFDGKTKTRWSVATDGAEWLEVDFKLARPLHRITLDQTGKVTEFPEHYEVFVTDDLKETGAARAAGRGQRNKTVIDLPAGTRGRYLIIKNTAEREESSWSVSELYLD